jgi:SPP1 gp7 family putative phage head morphogenesis protein
MTIDVKPLPFDEAIRFFQEKGMQISPDSYRDVWAAAHVQAFTVARVTQMDVLEDIRKAVDTAVKDGTPLNQFKKDLIPLLERRGWFSPKGEDAEIKMPDGTTRKRLTPWRLDNIYRTNLQSAYHAGRYRQMLENAPNRPWWMYDAVNDSRTRPSHAAMDGKVYRFDHPIWDSWHPPVGYRCRCTLRSLSDQDMKRTGKRESISPPLAKPDPGFDYNPGMVKWKPDLNKYTPEAYRILDAANLGVPTNTTQLGELMTRARDGMKQTGMLASDAPLTIKIETNPGNNGSANYRTGEINLKRDWLNAVNNSLKAGKVSTQEEMNAFKTLTHEFGHHLGNELQFPAYQVDKSYRYLAQTVNDVWARHKTPNFIGMFGLRYERAQATQLVAYHPTGYQVYVERFRSILRAAGISEAEEVNLVTRLNLSVDSMDYSDEMWKVLKEKKPSLPAAGSFGDCLRDESLYDLLMDELNG